MRRVMFSALLFVIPLTPISTLAQKARNVSIDGSNPSHEFEQGVISALNARLTAATRFSMTDVNGAELVINLMCLNMKDLGLSATKGGLCSYTVTYYPDDLAGLNVVLTGPAIAANDEPFKVAEAMFQEFVKVSTEEKLKKRLEILHSSIRLYEAKLAKAKR